MPLATPYTTPVETPTVPTRPLLLLHVPPAGVPVSVVVLPAQIVVVPVMGAGSAFTVATAVLKQPLGDSLYVMVALPGVVPPVITPVPIPIVAVPVALLLHVPVPGLLVSVEVAPSHMLSVPAIGAGKGFTDTVAEMLQPEPSE